MQKKQNSAFFDLATAAIISQIHPQCIYSNSQGTHSIPQEGYSLFDP